MATEIGKSAPSSGLDAELSETARTIVANTGWLVFAQLACGAIQFGTFALLARHLGPLGYGRWGFAYAFVALFAVAADFGLSTLAVRDLARGSSRTSVYVGTGAAMKLVVGVVLYAVIAAFERLVNDDPQARVLVYLLGAQMLLASAALFLYSVFRAQERMEIEATIRIGQSLLLLMTMAVLTSRGASLAMLASGYLLVTAAGTAVAGAIAMWRFVPLPLKVDLALARRLLVELLPLGAGMIASAFYYYFDTVLMGALGQKTEVGWYTSAYVPILWVAGLVTLVRTAFLPSQSRALLGEGDPRPLLRFYGRVSVGLGLPIAVGGVLIARRLLVFVYGSEYEPATFALQMLCLTAGVMFLSSYYGSHLLVLGRQRVYLLGVATGAVLNVGLNLLLVPRYSLNGAAITTLLAESAVFAFMFWQSRRLLAPREILAFARVPAAAVGVLAIVLVPASLVLPTLLAIALAAATYLAVALRLGFLAEITGDGARRAVEGTAI